MQHLQPRQQGSFVWGFNNAKSLTLLECTTYSVFIGTSQVQGQPAPVGPYTMIAYPVQGIPSAYPLNLVGVNGQWTANYPAGTVLMLGVVDANGNSGGIPPEIYTMQPGQSQACIPPVTTPVVSMKLDVPPGFKTCSVLPIHIDGGQKPYTVTLAVADSVSATNRTLGSDDDTFEWVNQSAPNSTFIFAVSDSKGQYATTSALFTTVGSTDVSCPGQSSRSYNSKNPNGSSSNNGSPNSSTSNNNPNNNPNPTNNPTNTNDPYNSTNSGSGSSDNNQKAQIPLAAIVGAAVGGMVVLSLLLLLFFRQRRNKPPGGVGYRERKGYGRATTEQSPDGSQVPFSPHYVGEPMHQDRVLLTPFIPGDPRSSAALDYYGDNPASPTYPPPSSVLTPVKYQPRTDNQQWGQNVVWQSNIPHPPPSPVASSIYPSNAYQGRVTPTGQYAADVVPPVSPQRTLTTITTSMYSDSGSTYTAQKPLLSQGSEKSHSVPPGAAGAVSGKTADPGQAAPSSRPTSGPSRVYQHEDGGVLELPPAYHNLSSAPPP